MPSSWICARIGLVRTDVSEDIFASIFRVAIEIFSTLRMKWKYSYETSVLTTPTRGHISEDGIRRYSCFYGSNETGSTCMALMLLPSPAAPSTPSCNSNCLYRISLFLYTFLNPFIYHHVFLLCEVVRLTQVQVGEKREGVVGMLQRRGGVGYWKQMQHQGNAM
jgi:hypothetical protein